MKARPILFSAPMVRAIMDGKKSQTRRVVKPQPSGYVVNVYRPFPHEPNNWQGFGGDYIHWYGRCPYGQPGDQLIPAMEIPSLGKNYCADIFGRIWSRARDKQTWCLLKGSPNGKGYLTVTPALNGEYKTKLVHRLVAESFYGFEPNGFKQVRHLDGNQINNNPDNLDWGTQEQNWTDRLLHGKSLGENHHSSKLTKENIALIRASNKSQRNLAKEFNVSQSLIQLIKTNAVWKENVTQDNPNMPRWASRIQLEITGIRVEHLQNISEEDAIAEGIKRHPKFPTMWLRGSLHGDQNKVTNTAFHRLAYRSIWESINGAESWDANPWVWVIEFRRIKP